MSVRPPTARAYLDLVHAARRRIRRKPADERMQTIGAVEAGVRGSPTALMERLDALTDPERVEEANMLAGWRTKYENEITGRMKYKRWQRMARRRNVGGTSEGGHRRTQTANGGQSH